MYDKEELLEIYENLKKGIVNKKELLPIKSKLLFVIKKVKFKHLFALNDLIDVLLILDKEDKLEILNQELIDFGKLIKDDTYLPCFIFGITYDNNRLSRDVLENSEKIFSLGTSFNASFKALYNNYNCFNYLNKINNIYATIAVKFTNLKKRLLSKKYHDMDMFILSTVLEIITTFVYINIANYDYNYDLIEICMDEIEDNLVKYFVYFLENQLWCIDIGLLPKSVGGFTHEFIVIGDLVNKIYEDIKNKKLSR